MISVVRIVMHILNPVKNLFLKPSTFLSQEQLFLNRKASQWLHTWETVLWEWILKNLNRQLVVQFKKLNTFVGILICVPAV